MNTLLNLVQTLRACPTHEASVSREMFLECWDELQREDVTPLAKPTMPIMAALLLNDDRFRGLLQEEEILQLLAIVQLAQNRYEQQANPPNKFGKLLAGCFTEDEI
jgi:hypothetical protein